MFLRRNPSILFALFGTWLVWYIHVRLLRISTPKMLINWFEQRRASSRSWCSLGLLVLFCVRCAFRWERRTFARYFPICIKHWCHSGVKNCLEVKLSPCTWCSHGKEPNVWCNCIQYSTVGHVQNSKHSAFGEFLNSLVMKLLLGGLSVAKFWRNYRGVLLMPVCLSL